MSKYIATVSEDEGSEHQLVYREDNGVPIPESLESVLARVTELAEGFPDFIYCIWKLDEVITGRVIPTKYNVAFMADENTVKLVYADDITVFTGSKELAQERMNFLKRYNPHINYFIIEAING